MRIMQIASGTDVSGATAHCLLVGRELAKRGHEIVFLCRPRSWIAERAVTDGYQVLTSDLRRWPADELRRVSALLQTRGIDVVHTHMSRAHSFGVLLRWMSGIPCVATAHSCRIQFHWMFNDLVIAVSHRTRRFHECYNLVQPHRIRTIHNFIDDRHADPLPARERREIRRSLGVREGEFLVGAIGTILPKKGQLHLIRALPQILERVPHTRLLLVGHLNSKDYASKMKAEAAATGVDSHVTLTGCRSDVWRILSAVDLSVLPSLEENFPLVILESMAASVPVVATDVGGVAESVVPGKTGLLVPPADPAALVEAIVSLAESPQTRTLMGRAGRERLLRSFSADSQVAQIEKSLASVVAGSAARVRAA